MNSKSKIWRQLCDPVKGVAAAAVPQLSVHPLVLVAHPDDETIGASALLGRLSGGVVAFCTDGAPNDRRFWSPDATGSRTEYAALRYKEAHAALQVLGIGSDKIVFLGGVDQDAICEVPKLVEALLSSLRKFKPDILITLAYEGGHPDHDAASLVAHIAVNQLQHEHRPELVEMPLYHARDGQTVMAEFLPNLQDGTPPPPELIVQLSPEEIARKQQMVECHHSQRLVVQGFPLEQERFRPAPAYDYSRPPHPGRLWYECRGWPMTGERWRRYATAAIGHWRQTACG